MARNRHPEATVERILAEAARLFLQKGYEKTSMQDIMEGTGLSKGAIYHHFSSKEDILLRIGERMGEENAAALQRVLDAPGLNGAQKLKEVFRTALQGERQAQMLRMIPFLIDNPRFLAIHVREIFELVAPAYIAPILEEGARDGSLRVERPREMAEALMVLSDMWINPLLRPATPEEVRQRCRTFIAITAALGLDILDEAMVERCVDYARWRAQASGGNKLNRRDPLPLRGAAFLSH